MPNQKITESSGHSLYTLSRLSSLGERRKIKRERAIFNTFLPMLQRGSLILEAGPGRGHFAEVCNEEGYDYIGIEPSEDLRRKLVSKGIMTIEQPLPNIALEDKSVDLIHSNDVVEHLENYQTILLFFQESHRVLKHGGFISTIVPNCETLGMLFYKYEYQHCFITTVNRIEALLQDAGFKLIDSKAFLTNLGLSRFHFLDRIIAHTVLFFARSIILSSILECLLGKKMMFRINKNLFDHVGIIAQKT